MKAITTTIELKTTNPDWFGSKTIGVPTILEGQNVGGLPKYFNSITYNSGRRTDMYHKLDGAVHLADGFYDVIEPTLDPSTQKKGELIFSVDHFTYEVLAMSQQEQDAYVQEQLDGDDEQVFINTRSSDGKLMISRFFAHIRRQLVNVTLSPANAATAGNLIFDAITPLQYGQFELAKNRLNGINTVGLNQPVIDLINLAKQKIQDYLDNE